MAIYFSITSFDRFDDDGATMDEARLGKTTFILRHSNILAEQVCASTSWNNVDEEC